MRPDFSIEELGEVDCDTGLSRFDSFDWSGAVQAARDYERQGEDVVDPSMTFTLEKVHLSVSSFDAATFNVEVCVPRKRKLFGLFAAVKFYQFGPAGSGTVSAAIRSFLADPPDRQHEVFAEMERRVA